MYQGEIHQQATPIPRQTREIFPPLSPSGEINYGFSGIGTTVHLSSEWFQSMTGIKWVHIAYKCGGPGLVASPTGEVSLFLGNVPTMIRQVRSGKLRAIAVTGPKRSSAASVFPTVKEIGVPGYEVTSWYGLRYPQRPSVLSSIDSTVQ